MEKLDSEFWEHLDRLVAASRIVIDRPKSSAHPRYPEKIYPLDYGYLQGTRAGDGQGIDVWIGSGAPVPNAILCTGDLWKKDAELKVLLGCSEAEIAVIMTFLNEGDAMRCLAIRR